MKNLILILSMSIIMTQMVLASNIGDGILNILSTETVEFSFDNMNDQSYILTTNYNDINDHVEMIFIENVSMVHIFNQEGELEMMFPIDSKEVNFGMSLFQTGNYRLAFIMDENIQYTSLIIK